MTIVAILSFIYSMPMLIACYRRHVNFAPIVLVNLLLGWTLIGWLFALIWAATNNTEKRKGKQNA